MRGKGIRLDSDYGLQTVVTRGSDGRIVSGLQVGDTLYQNQALILIFQPGEVKTNPVVGVGINDAINDNDFLGWRRLIRQQLELDRQEVTKIIFGGNEKVEIDAKYYS